MAETVDKAGGKQVFNPAEFHLRAAAEVVEKDAVLKMLSDTNPVTSEHVRAMRVASGIPGSSSTFEVDVKPNDGPVRNYVATVANIGDPDARLWSSLTTLSDGAGKFSEAFAAGLNGTMYSRYKNFRDNAEFGGSKVGGWGKPTTLTDASGTPIAQMTRTFEEQADDGHFVINETLSSLDGKPKGKITIDRHQVGDVLDDEVKFTPATK